MEQAFPLEDVVYLMLKVEMKGRMSSMGQYDAGSLHPLLSGLPATAEVVVDTAMKGMGKVPTLNKPGRLDTGAWSS